jgi:uncharacterized protein YbjT (DUF2867 family)
VADTPVAVIGGAGRIGRRVALLLLAEGIPVRVLTREPARARRVVPDGVPCYQADVRNPATLAQPLSGCGGVVFSVEPGTAESGPDSPRASMYDGVRHVLDALDERPHVVLVSQIYVTRHDHPQNRVGRMLDWRLAGEDLVRGSGRQYTIIRPSWLTERRDGGPGVRLEQGDRGDGRISRDDVAQACVWALRSPEAGGLTFEMYNGVGTTPTDWSALFAALKPDAAAPRVRVR